MSAVDWQVVSVQMAAAPVWYCANNVTRRISFWSLSQPAPFWKPLGGSDSETGEIVFGRFVRRLGPLFKGAFNRAHMLWDAKEPTSPLPFLNFKLSFPLSLILLWVPLLHSVVLLPAIDLCNTPPAQVWICLSLMLYRSLSSLLGGFLPLFLLQTPAPSPSRSLSPQAVHM